MPVPSGASDRAGVDLLAEVVRDTVSRFVATVHPSAAGPHVTAATHLEADLGLDSLTIAELLVVLEQALGRRLPESCLADVATVGDLVAAAASGRCTGVGGTRVAAVADVATGGATVPPATRAGGATPYAVYALAVSALLGVIGWTLGIVLPGAERRWRVVCALARLLLAATGTRLRVSGREHLPPHGAYVVVANHPSFVDPLVLALLLPPGVRFTAIEGLVANPLVAWFLRRMPVELVPNREERRRAIASAAVLTRQARLGRRLVFFPEGRRSTAVGLERFRMGAFVVASEADVPVVPITIRGTRAILPVGARWPRRGEIEVLVGAPIAPSGPAFEQAVALQRLARADILRHCDEPDLDHVSR